MKEEQKENGWLTPSRHCCSVQAVDRSLLLPWEIWQMIGMKQNVACSFDALLSHGSSFGWRDSQKTVCHPAH